MIGLLALASLALSAVSDGEKEPVDLQRALALAKTLNDPSILADAIVAQGFARERELIIRMAKKLETSPPDVRAFLERVLKACRGARGRENRQRFPWKLGLRHRLRSGWEDACDGVI
jgi:hypothetical protein